MKEQIKKVFEAAEGNEEAKAILAGITPETPTQDALAIVAEAAEKLGIAFDASQPLTDEELGEVAAGKSFFYGICNAEANYVRYKPIKNPPYL